MTRNTDYVKWSPRQRLHRHWLKAGEGEALLRQVERLHDGWIDRYNDWHVDHYGERPGGEPWALRPVSRFVAWCDDWRVTWRIRP